MTAISDIKKRAESLSLIIREHDAQESAVMGKIMSSIVKLDLVAKIQPETRRKITHTRFLTSADSLMESLEKLSAIRSEDKIDVEIKVWDEAGLAASSLMAMAEEMRVEAVSSIQAEISTTRSMIQDWEGPESDDLHLAQHGKGELSSKFLSFLNKDDKMVPAIKTEGQGGFFSKIKEMAKKRESPKPTGPLTHFISDENMSSILRDAKQAENKALSEMEDDDWEPSLFMFGRMRYEGDHLVYEAYKDNDMFGFTPNNGDRLMSDNIKNSGLRVGVSGIYINITLTDEFPENLTEIWKKLADLKTNDWKSFRKALMFKGDDTFREAVRTSLSEAMNDLEAQIINGEAEPFMHIEDPVVRAAVIFTIHDMHSVEFGKIPGLRPYDPFKIKGALLKLEKELDGINFMIDAQRGGIGMLPVKSVGAEYGLTEMLHKNVRQGKETSPEEYSCEP